MSLQMNCHRYTGVMCRRALDKRDLRYLFVLGCYIKKKSLFNHTVYLKFSERVDYKYFHCTHKKITTWGNGYVNCFNYSNHFPVYIYVKHLVMHINIYIYFIKNKQNPHWKIKPSNLNENKHFFYLVATYLELLFFRNTFFSKLKISFLILFWAESC